ncbi:sensor histidine kinase [Acanthopleuribacter pedis]|uniref:Histidine kinase domain-containing protein n=1 Tax=Acanthopleuribacter pedis TaxID=442870 RepID=A0A8J7QCT5_9BACT|nr:sensor histidine kinase [Acanthopleuribacter pedis]MBO1321409.1 hypothetical protein [Acanthopleuribacter pedis]
MSVHFVLWFSVNVLGFSGAQSFVDVAALDGRVRLLGGSVGLSQGNVFCVTQDRFGFIWAGTENGLNRYNGKDFQQFLYRSDAANGLSDDWISALLPDPSGALWIGTRFGVDRFDPVTETFRNVPFARGTREGWCLARDPQNRLWYGTDDGLFRVDLDAGVVRRDPHSPNWPVRAVLVHGQSLWLGTWGGGLFRMSPGGVPEPVALPGQVTHIRSMVLDRDGRLWLGTAAGAHAFDPVTGEPIGTWLSDWEVPSLAEDRAGRLWIGTRGKGPHVLSPDRTQLQALTTDVHGAPLDAAVVWQCQPDRTGVMWFGFAGGRGLGRLVAPLFSLARPHRETLGGDVAPGVWALHQDRQKRLWLGGETGLMQRVAPNGPWRCLSRAGRVPRARVWALAEPAPGDLWLSTNSAGLLRLDVATETTRRVPLPGLTGTANVMALVWDGRFLWAGTRRAGLFRINPKNEQVVSLADYAGASVFDPTGGIFALCPDRRGGVWLGTDGAGLLHWDENQQRFQAFPIVDPASSTRRTQRLWALHLDAANNLWLGYKSGGLAVKSARHGAITRFTTANSDLADNTVYAVQSDRSGMIWLSTNRGLSRFDPKTEAWLNFAPIHGLQDSEFNLGAAFTASDGVLTFGGVAGLNWFDPMGLPLVNDPVPVTLTRLTMPGRAPRRLPRGPVQLQPGVEALTFDFARLAYEAPDRVKTEYLLEGVDADWQTQTGNVGSARYTFLPPGEYQFRVRATDALGRRSRQETTLAFSIPPTFWQRPTVRLAGLLVVIMALMVAARLVRAHQRRTQAWVQESLERERAALEERLHDGPLQIVKKLHARLEQGHRDALSEQGMLDGLTQLRGSVQDVCFQLLPPALRLFSLSVALEDALTAAGEAAPDVAVSFSCTGADETLPSSVKFALYAVFEKALQNVLAHAHAKNLSVVLTVHAREVRLEVTDDGVGFEGLPAASQRARQKHFGLICAQDRVEAVRGRLQLETAPGRGTRLFVTVPLPGAVFSRFDPRFGSWFRRKEVRF